mgnify:CR=1 FL=1
MISFPFWEVMSHTQKRGEEPLNRLYPDQTEIGSYAAWPWGVSRLIDGLEMTATPTDEKGKSFKNIVYEYNLAQALDDGKYVKVPTVARRKNFTRGTLSDEELDILKIEDAIKNSPKIK